MKCVPCHHADSFRFVVEVLLLFDTVFVIGQFKKCLETISTPFDTTANTVHAIQLRDTFA